MAVDPPLKAWTQAEMDALGATADDLQPKNGLRIMTKAEVANEVCMSAEEMQALAGDGQFETLRRHKKIRRRGRARAGKGQLILPLKHDGDDR
jgi:hypothetical protein